MTILKRDITIFVSFEISQLKYKSKIICDNCQKNKSLAELVFDFCEECNKMASVPQGAFAACKLRQYADKKNLTVARIQSGEKRETKNFNNKKPTEFSPVKYNGKLMNSIWGFYNRYSPHNIKGNDDEQSNCLFLQQPLTVAGYVIAQNVAMACSGNEWKISETK